LRHAAEGGIIAGETGLMENSEIATLFARMAELLELQGADIFRIRAYRTAALNIESLSPRLEEVARDDPQALRSVAGIGEKLAEKIREIVATGTFKQYEQLRKQIPVGVLEMLHLEGLGPKKVKKLYDQLHIRDLAGLEAACRAGTVAQLEGMGEKTQAKLLETLAHYRQTEGRFLLAEVAQFAQSLTRYATRSPVFTRVDVAGSVRRGQETIGDLDLLAVVRDRAKAAEHILQYPDVEHVIQRGTEKCAMRLKSGLQVDVRFIDAARFGAALIYFTGSKAHNVKIRTLAKQRSLKISEYGVFRGASTTPIAAATEADVYRTLGMAWVPPELREDRGEVDAARAHQLPKLIELEDVQGDVHAHTNATDGRHSIHEMLEAAKAKGYAYVAITDHTKSTRVAGGLNDRQMHAHLKAIRLAATRVTGLRVLCGAEVDILPDGSLDLSDATLKDMDLVVASIHSHFKMSEAAMTTRILKAFDHRSVAIFAHPTGRLIGTRPPYLMKFDTIIAAATERGIALEINAHPSRTDLNDSHCKFAKERGAKFVISTDAHTRQDFDLMRFGVTTARRGWLEASDILNTKPLARFLSSLRKT